MKYIRTKDGIYEFCWVSDKTYSLKKKGNIDFKDIIGQSNNIEKLCDVFVLTWDDQKRLHSSLEEALFWKQEVAERTEYFGTIYGAIWTDKGLIYVAKMNDKGELELL